MAVDAQTADLAEVLVLKLRYSSILSENGNANQQQERGAVEAGSVSLFP